MLWKYEVGIAVFEMTEITGRADIIHISDTLVFCCYLTFFGGHIALVLLSRGVLLGAILGIPQPIRNI